ncbi:MAG: DedA family protein [Bacteroidales bacterium]|jgi:membrane protein DedA with SNARE-associated domain|nr:DedA family protein [Bacteroidales bacterium]
MSEVFTDITTWYMDHINYWTITLLMAIESSFIPFPSEIVVPPAAYKAAQGELNIYLVIFFSTLGAMIGALFNYYLALTIGRAAIYSFARTRFARMMLVEPKSIQKAEDYFVKNGKISTLIGRLIPAVRQLISIPAGLAKMPLKYFLLYTFIGATGWNIILALLGYFAPKELFELYYKEISFVMIGLGVLFVMYLVYKGFFQKKSA